MLQRRRAQGCNCNINDTVISFRKFSIPGPLEDSLNDGLLLISCFKRSYRLLKPFSVLNVCNELK